MFSRPSQGERDTVRRRGRGPMLPGGGLQLRSLMATCEQKSGPPEVRSVLVSGSAAAPAPRSPRPALAAAALSPSEIVVRQFPCARRGWLGRLVRGCSGCRDCWFRAGYGLNRRGGGGRLLRLAGLGRVRATGGRMRLGGRRLRQFIDMGTLKGFPCPPALVRRRRGRARSARGGQGGGLSRSPRRGRSRRAPHASSPSLG
jgi:hypothetical protein